MNITKLTEDSLTLDSILGAAGAGAGQSPDFSCVFSLNIVGALPQWVWQKQESPRSTEQCRVSPARSTVTLVTRNGLCH